MPVAMEEEESCCVPPGFRFHPTEEELVGYYLARKVASQNIDLDIIQEVDLYRIEPWDLLQERCKYGGGQEQQEWYFFSYKDRKYPSGTRTNRATAAGFWKATGRDKPVMSRSGGRVIGMRKTLVFYKGRAPNGRKTDWIMHEYRLLQSNDHHQPAQEEGWVVCRAFRKPIPNHQRPSSSLLYHPGAGGGYYVDGDHHHHHFLGSTSLLYPDERGIIPQLYADDDLIESKNNKHLLLSIPQLIHNDADDELQKIQGGGGLQQAAGAIDWNFLDTLLSSSMTPPTLQLHDPSSSSLQFQ